MIGLRLMIATVALCATAGLSARAAPVFPEPPGAEEPGRYRFATVDDGLMRLDTQTGAVSHCARRPSGWSCEALPDDRTALESEIARLAGENDKLSARVSALQKELETARAAPPPVPPQTVPNPARPPAATPPPEGRDLPSDAEIDRMMTFAEKMFRRFLDMVDRLRAEQRPTAPPQKL